MPMRTSSNPALYTFDAAKRAEHGNICGVDEAGRGPLCGPVCVAAVILNPDDPIEGVNDSKKLSEKKRETLFDTICSQCAAYGIGSATEKEIDEINILNATYLAMQRAVAALPVLCEYCLPLVRVGGVFIAMKGPDADAELGGSAAALKKLGGAYGDTRAFTLPDGSERRLVVCKKISQTPTAYPRNGGKIAKKPL